MRIMAFMCLLVGAFGQGLQTLDQSALASLGLAPGTYIIRVEEAEGQGPLPAPAPVATGCDGVNQGYGPGPTCQSFVVCSNGAAAAFECPDGLFWSQSQVRCVREENSECGKSGLSGPSTFVVPSVQVLPPAPAPAPVAVSCGGIADGFLPGPSCGQFTSCSNGEGIVMDCPENLMWSQNALQCLQPEDSECGRGGVPVAVAPPASCSEADGFIPASNPNQFVSCSNGEGITMDCALGPDGPTTWDQTLLMCI